LGVGGWIPLTLFSLISMEFKAYLSFKLMEFKAPTQYIVYINLTGFWTSLTNASPATAFFTNKS
jgi:hypothetical protein